MWRMLIAGVQVFITAIYWYDYLTHRKGILFCLWATFVTVALCYWAWAYARKHEDDL